MGLNAVTGVAFGLAVLAAVRSTWSPCGLSMLSTLTPLGERGRGHRYPLTVVWFVAGATLGGTVLGALIAGLAALVRSASLSPSDTAALVTVVLAMTVASDLRLGGFHLPLVPRQVDEQWTSRYRRWVYATGFGAQIGVGVSTYVMTAAVYATVALGALTARPLAGGLIGVGFGLVRGLAVLPGLTLTTPARLRDFHRRIDAMAPLSLATVIAAQVVVLGLAAVSLGAVATLAVVVAGLAAATAVVLRRRRVSTFPREIGFEPSC